MIYSTNRTASIGEVEVDVNESYFGEGSMYFMQEAAQDELALFEMAIKTDIDEVLIGESASELEALNESFVEKTVNKIKELMRKFIEWLKGVTRSALAKLNQFIVRDNVQFCKNAKKMLSKMRNKDFKATGTILANTNVGMEDLEKFAKDAEDLLSTKTDGLTMDQAKDLAEEIESKMKEQMEKADEAAFIENKEYGLKEVDDHIKFLETTSKSNVKKIKQTIDRFEKKAKEAAKSAEKKARDNKDDEKKDQLAVDAYMASQLKSIGQTIVKRGLSSLKKMIKVARAVVTRAAGAKNEGVEYSPEYIEALIEADNYELDEALEEMSEAKKSDCDDDIEDDEE